MFQLSVRYYGETKNTIGNAVLHLTAVGTFSSLTINIHI